MSPVSIVVRDLTPAELERVRAGFDEYARAQGVPLESVERFGTVALDGAEFVGAASALAYRNGGEYTGWSYLTDLFVERPHRGRGVGTRLLDGLEAALRNVSVTRIWTWTAAHEARGFYARQGYTLFAELEDWSVGGGSRYGMRKDLRRGLA